jgi:cytochrome c-type biogenesis protein CcmH/NrfF
VTALAWWLIPLVATAMAVVWVTWVSRPRRRADTHESLAEHQRFLAALSQPASAPAPASPEWTPRDERDDDET